MSDIQIPYNTCKRREVPTLPVSVSSRYYRKHLSGNRVKLLESSTNGKTAMGDRRVCDRTIDINPKTSVVAVKGTARIALSAPREGLACFELQ